MGFVGLIDEGPQLARVQLAAGPTFAKVRGIQSPRRYRWIQGQDAPREVAAAPVRRLFARTPYGITVWASAVMERYVCHRPLNGIAVWLGYQGLTISPGTLAGGLGRMEAWFEPLAQAILDHQNSAPVRHGDETGWRVQELRRDGRSARAWLWISVTPDAVYYHVDATRSAAAALDRQRDVGVDAPRHAMVYRAQPQFAFQLTPGLLHAVQLLVAQRQVLGAERFVVAVHHELAVAPLRRLDLGAVDARMPTPGQAQIPPVATAGAQFADPLAALFAVGEAGQRGQFGLQLRQHFLVKRALAFGFAGVEAHRVTATAFALSDGDFLDGQCQLRFWHELKAEHAWTGTTGNKFMDR